MNLTLELPPKQVGRFLQDLREEHNLSLNEAAEKIGTNQFNLKNLESGKRRISAKLLYVYVSKILGNADVALERILIMAISGRLVKTKKTKK